jgi:hypothetical protein
MTIGPAWLFLSLIPSGIGLVLLMYGKKQERWAHAAAGLALMVYPYFATNVTTLLVGGGAIWLGLWYAIRLGW